MSNVSTILNKVAKAFASANHAILSAARTKLVAMFDIGQAINSETKQFEVRDEMATFTEFTMDNPSSWKSTYSMAFRWSKFLAETSITQKQWATYCEKTTSTSLRLHGEIFKALEKADFDWALLNADNLLTIVNVAKGFDSKAKGEFFAKFAKDQSIVSLSQGELKEKLARNVKSKATKARNQKAKETEQKEQETEKQFEEKYRSLLAEKDAKIKELQNTIADLTNEIFNLKEKQTKQSAHHLLRLQEVGKKYGSVTA